MAAIRFMITANLRDHHPLQQGLRLHNPPYDSSHICNILRDHHPLQQGLRPCDLLHNLHLLQASRPSSITTRIKTFTMRLRFSGVSSLRDHHPLQQGLRRSLMMSSLVVTSRPSSITTRIKTIIETLASLGFNCSSRPSSITTRIKTGLTLECR